MQQEIGPSGILFPRELVRPSEVIPPGGNGPDITCPFCGAHPASAPEGVNFDGSPKWDHENWHCWKCGYKPNVTQGVGEVQMRQQFEAFKAWLADQMAASMSHPTMQPPAPATTDQSVLAQMQAQIQQMQNDLAGRNSPGMAPASNQADLSQPGTTVSPVPAVPASQINPQ